MENQKLFKRSTIEKKTSQQQEEYRKRKVLERVKSKFINLLMRNGEKSKARKLFELSTNNLQPTLDQTSGELCKRKNQDFFNLFKREKRKNPISSLGKISIGKTNPNSRLPYGSKETKRNTIFLKDSDDFLKNNTLYQAVENVKPTLELRRVRKGGTTYQVPAIVKEKRGERLAIKWIIESAEKRKKKNKQCFSNCLVREIMEAFNKTGQPRQKRDEQLKIAEYNRAYTRYRWW